uniref:Ig-like domain-containing protein n=1 Tax=Oncorhynchus kisutch TaxID=8019 RepID=A0A8C7CK30_ONCKI
MARPHLPRCSTCVVLNSSRISQTPEAVIVRPKRSSSLSCSHNTTNVFYMYWYRRPAQSRALTLVGYLYSGTANLETDFTNDRFSLQGNAGSRGDLQISNPTTEDSGEYFCRCDTGSVPYFGNGTKLTVLDIPVTPPKVKVLPPSTKECEDRNKKKKKTLVCVATDFYPDHVTVFWKLNGGANITDGVGTDNTALRDENRRYSITSRLRVPAKTWNTASNRFTCTVRFFNGTDDIYVPVSCETLLCFLHVKVVMEG